VKLIGFSDLTLNDVPWGIWYSWTKARQGTPLRMQQDAEQETGGRAV
jgi:hypothetical protein